MRVHAGVSSEADRQIFGRTAIDVEDVALAVKAHALYVATTFAPVPEILEVPNPLLVPAAATLEITSTLALVPNAWL